MNIIVQDYDENVLELLTLCLAMEGIRVLPLKGTDDILDKIQIFDPDMVILDYKLRATSAIRSCRLIKQIYPQLPVIAISCNIDIRSEYSRNGFDDYIKKPFDIDRLLAIVNRHRTRDNDLLAH
jgi:DNA-binding response OmpR family regulator